MTVGGHDTLCLGERSAVGDTNVLIIVAVLLICLGGYLWWHRWLQRHKLTPLEWPVVGLLPQWHANWYRYHDFITEFLYKGHTHRFHIGFGFMAVVTVDPANVEYIMKTNFNNYPKVRLFCSRVYSHPKVCLSICHCKVYSSLIFAQTLQTPVDASCTAHRGSFCVVCELVNWKGAKANCDQRRLFWTRNLQRRWRFVDSPEESGSH